MTEQEDLVLLHYEDTLKVWEWWRSSGTMLVLGHVEAKLLIATNVINGKKK